MQTNDSVVDVYEMADRVMIDLFKKKIQETNLNAGQLKGSWAEAIDILRNHFGKISRIMDQNQYKLHNLYQIAIKELKLL
jgi:hypothetical protein